MGASQSSGLVTEAVLAGGVGLVGVLASVFLVIWFGRKVTGDLTRLDGSVRAMAEERLPRVVERLRRGDDVDVLAESPPPAASGIREVSQIARSFATVQQAAVAAAVEQARLRRGINKVFLNISLRNQSLLHRQLGMLDGMERRTSDPAALADLFRLDHLTTRMRRHAEGLIILSGSTPGRGWRDPVPVIDVLRAAIAEVEDYVRVDVVSESPRPGGRDRRQRHHPPSRGAGGERHRLLPAQHQDRGQGGPGGHRPGRGGRRPRAGPAADEMADINRLARQPAEFDLVNSEQLGLFVVSSLAARHQIKVSLRRSAYGGTTAILLLPFGVIVREEEVESPADGQPAGLAGPRPDLGAPAEPEPALDRGRRPVAVRRDWPAPADRGRDRAARGHRREPLAARTRSGPRRPGPPRGRPGNTRSRNGSRNRRRCAAPARPAGSGAATVGRGCVPAGRSRPSGT